MITSWSYNRFSARRTALGFARGHWGEFIQGWIRDHEHEQTVVLVTLHDPVCWVKARVTLVEGSSQVVVDPPSYVKVKRTVETVFKLFRREGMGCTVRFASNMPLTGKGTGRSTTECVAAARAVLRLLGGELSDLEILQDVIHPAEGPCDPLTSFEWGATVLWGSRLGYAHRVWPRRTPPFLVLAFDPAPHKQVPTIEFVEKCDRQFDPGELDLFADILAHFETGLIRGDARVVAEAAQRSAQLSQKRCPIDRWAALLDIGRESSALGVTASHSGTVAAMLWSPSDERWRMQLPAALAKLQDLGAGSLHAFVSPYGKTTSIPLNLATL